VKRFLLDSSFVIDLLDDVSKGKLGSAAIWLGKNPHAQLWISPVTVAEVLEGAVDPAAVKSYLARFNWQGIHRMHAERVASTQGRASRRLGENDAWQVSIARCMQAGIVGHDRAFRVLGSDYQDHRTG
jgi:predicted nucleic acid-binding protein